MLAIARERVVAMLRKILKSGLAPSFASALASAALSIGVGTRATAVVRELRRPNRQCAA